LFPVTKRKKHLIRLPFLMQSGNPFLDSNFDSTSHNALPDTAPRPCATAYQHQAAFFQLPASRPYDNFLKAAGCWFVVEKMVILIVELLDHTFLTLVHIEEDARKTCTGCFLDHEFATIFMVGSVFFRATIINQTVHWVIYLFLDLLPARRPIFYQRPCKCFRDFFMCI